MTDTQNLPTTLSPAEGLRVVLEKQKHAIVAALPQHVSVDKFIRTTVTAVTMQPELLSADRQSLYTAVVRCATDGLIPDGREAALVIFNTKDKGKVVQFLPMIAGILKKVRNSGEIKTIGSQVVHENDKFHYILGDEERIEHVPNLENPGRPTAAYAIVVTKDGGVYREVMTEAQIQQVRNVSRAKDSGPWSGPFADEMRRKTVLRRLSKRLPMSTDLEGMIRADDDVFMPPPEEAQPEQPPKQQATRTREKILGKDAAAGSSAAAQRQPTTVDAERSPEPPPPSPRPQDLADDIPI